MTRPGTSPATIRVSIVGASGYVGGELLRLCLGHPDVEVAQVTSESNVGKPVRTKHPNLRGHTDVRFTSIDALEKCDVLFLGLPHGESASRIEHFADRAERIVDCSADFRLDDAGAYEDTYRAAHPAPDWLERFVYGLPEANRERIAGARYVSGVGCNATATNLALLPLVRAGLLDADRGVIADLKVGSSEAGRKASEGGHHPERSGVVRSYAPVDHRHTAEVRQVLGLADVHLSVTSVELVRGALATCHAWLAEPASDRELWKAWRAAYGEEPFVRTIHDKGGAYRHPEPRLVTGTNHADVGWALAADGRRIVAIGAIDNLMKGAAGTAVQCMNLMCGFDETSGLDTIGLHPH
ncbi:MAG: N-acetyl-gamma-glutamyl-phosphate reductase [bacterium]|nr:N-acetyl-gamma-glutamyl-phosphate reductase [bacterium]